jgi:hypothetical protein
MEQRLIGEMKRNIGAGASVAAVGFGQFYKVFEPVLLEMLVRKDGKHPLLNRIIDARLKSNAHYQRRLQ